jgi:MFS transporter, SP family, arabinose:H+ symporter
MDFVLCMMKYAAFPREDNRDRADSGVGIWRTTHKLDSYTRGITLREGTSPDRNFLRMMTSNTASASSAGRFLYLLVVCLVAALGGLLFGFDTAVISGTVGFFQAEFGLSAAGTGWVASSALVGCFFGALMAGALSDRFGRKKILVLSALFFTISALWCLLSRTSQDLVLARLVGGLGIGIASLTSPLYIAEIAPPKIRGMLVALQQLAIVLGILGAFFSNSLVLHTDLAEASKWRWMFGVGALPAVLFLALILPVPESPRWLTKQGLKEQARAILARVAGDDAADAEMVRISEAIAQEGGSWGELFRPGTMRAIGVGVTLMVLTQVTGINAIMYYAPEVFKHAGSAATTAFNDTVWVGLTNLVFTLLSMAVVDYLGRKPLLLIGSACMGLSLGFVGYSFYAGLSGLGVLVGVLAYVGSFAFSMGVVGWVLVSEIYPTRTRGRAMSLATGAVWAACFAVSLTFPIFKTISIAGTFWGYGLLCLVAILFVWFYVPETKGRTLEEIERSWTAS